MNNQEAIKWLKESIQDCTSGEDEPYKEAFGMAILALENEKQMSEKPNIQPFNDIMRKQKCYKVKCPKCGEKFFILEFINDKDRRFKEFGEWLNNCYNCGQKLNWR